MEFKSNVLGQGNEFVIISEDIDVGYVISEAIVGNWIDGTEKFEDTDGWRSILRTILAQWLRLEKERKE